MKLIINNKKRRCVLNVIKLSMTKKILKKSFLTCKRYTVLRYFFSLFNEYLNVTKTSSKLVIFLEQYDILFTVMRSDN